MVTQDDEAIRTGLGVANDQSVRPGLDAGPSTDRRPFEAEDSALS